MVLRCDVPERLPAVHCKHGSLRRQLPGLLYTKLAYLYDLLVILFQLGSILVSRSRRRRGLLVLLLWEMRQHFDVFDLLIRLVPAFPLERPISGAIRVRAVLSWYENVCFLLKGSSIVLSARQDAAPLMQLPYGERLRVHHGLVRALDRFVIKTN